MAKAFTKSAPKHQIYSKQWMWNNNKIVAILQRSNTSLRQMSVCCNRYTFVSIQIDVHSFIKLTGCVYPKTYSNNNRSLITQHNGDVLLPIFTVHTHFPFPSYGLVLFNKLTQRSIQIPTQKLYPSRAYAWIWNGDTFSCVFFLLYFPFLSQVIICFQWTVNASRQMAPNQSTHLFRSWK